MITFEEILLLTRNQELEFNPVYDFMVSKIIIDGFSVCFTNIISTGVVSSTNSNIHRYKIISNDKNILIDVSKQRQSDVLMRFFFPTSDISQKMTYNVEFTSFLANNDIDLICSDWLLSQLCSKKFLRKRKIEELNIFM
jgi:hypothetical protein